MPSPIFRLPNELIFDVVQQLPIVDAFQLGLTCKQFKNIVHDNSLCRVFLEKQAHFSPESKQASNTKQYSRAFRTLAKRRLAIASLQPYTATILATADSYLYVNGTLLYIQNRTLRILHLRDTVQQETVVDIRLLLDHAVEESKGTQLYKFTLLHYADDIVICRYTHCRLANETWLVLFHTREHWASSTRVAQPNLLFARSNADFVVYGTYTGRGDDGHRRWILWRYSIHERRVVGHSKYLGAIIGSEIGDNIYFTILDGYFYAISNQSGIEFITGQHNSYYYCCRFPLSNMEDMQVATKASLWRRLHDEGTIDDRWSFLRLEKNESTGAIVVVESRKEWRHGSGNSRRTYYTQELVFPQHKKEPHRASVAGSQDNDTGAGENAINRQWIHAGNQEESEEEEDDDDDDEYDDDDSEDDEAKNKNEFHSVTTTPGSFHATRRKQHRQPFRLPENVHPGDDSATMIHFTCSSCFVRCYYLGSATFMDLVDMPRDADPFTRRLRLRAGSRRTRPPQPYRTATPEKSTPDPLYPLQDMKRLYHTTQVAMWPADEPGEHDTGQSDPARAALDEVLNPPGHTGKVSGVWDDRSLVYGVERDGGGTNGKGLYAVVFVTFDPSIRLPHAQPGTVRASETRGSSVSFGSFAATNTPAAGAAGAAGAENPGAARDAAADWTADLADDQCLLPEDIQKDWWRISTTPMYQRIGRGVDFFYKTGS